MNSRRLPISIKFFVLIQALTIILSLPIFAQSLLYEVRGAGMENPVYIYGTIHALAQADFFVDDLVIESFKKSEIIVFEIDMSSPTMLLEVQNAMMMKDNSLDSLVSDDDYQRIKRFFADSLQLPLDFLKKVKPMMMSSFLLPKIVGSQPASYEAFFLEKAMEQNKIVKGIETIAEQVGYMDRIPLESQVKMLLESIDDFNKSREEFKKLVDIYRTRDVERVYQMILETSEEYQEFGQYLIDARNQNWIPRIIDFGNKGISFIAVGCGHLGGENGILNLLRREGYEVKEVE
jgi:hypothetical protein